MAAFMLTRPYHPQPMSPARFFGAGACARTRDAPAQTEAAAAPTNVRLLISGMTSPFCPQQWAPQKVQHGTNAPHMSYSFRTEDDDNVP
jgi:hypothetical protein